MLSWRKKCLRGDMRAVGKYLKGFYKEQRKHLPSLAADEGTDPWLEVAAKQRFPWDLRKNFFPVGAGRE